MKQIIRHVEYLVTQHDCVIIPGLGAILAHDKGAVCDVAKNTWTPPARCCTFNSQLPASDGLLATSIARSRGISYDAATRTISSAVDEMHSILKSGEALTLGHIGTLKLNNEGSAEFMPANYDCLFAATAWLPTLNIDYVSNSQTAVNDSDDDAIIVSPRTKLLRILRVAAAIAVLTAIGFVLSTPIRIPKPQFASLGPTIETTDTPAADLLGNRPGMMSSPLVLVLKAHPDGEELLTDKAAIAATAATDMTGDLSAGRYCLIVASLNSRAEADEYVSSHDSPLAVLEKDGRFRIYAASSDSKAELENASSIKDRWPDAWICRR